MCMDIYASKGNKASCAFKHKLRFEVALVNTAEEVTTMTERNRKVITWKSLLLLSMNCYGNKAASTVEDGVEKEEEEEEACEEELKSCSVQRLSLSDVSDPSSPLSVNDLSVSFTGPKLHAFAFSELKMATSNFSKSNLIGAGGFGPVHKGFIDEKLRPGLKAQCVAVKALNLEGFQGHREWLAEIIFLGQLKHPNLVNLIGYCCEEEKRLLVYEYISRGSLENHLFRRYSAVLPWRIRIKVALGAARGLAFLHELNKHVIYRDFKPSNILLDSNYNAKLSDLGLARDGPEGEDTHVTTRVMGTQGYAAPEYVMTGHLTAMSDVYSFGVVLLELLTGKRCLDKMRPSREHSLVEWGRHFLKDPWKLPQLMDPKLEGQFSIKEAKQVAQLAYRCLSHYPKPRPLMREVVTMLECLQELEDEVVIEPFVYVVPYETEKKKKCCLRQKGNVEDVSGEISGRYCFGWRHKSVCPY